MDVYEIKEALAYTHIGKLLKKYSGSDGILRLQAEIIGRVSKEIMCDDKSEISDSEIDQSEPVEEASVKLEELQSVEEPSLSTEPLAKKSGDSNPKNIPFFYKFGESQFGVNTQKLKGPLKNPQGSELLRLPL